MASDAEKAWRAVEVGEAGEAWREVKHWKQVQKQNEFLTVFIRG